MCQSCNTQEPQLLPAITDVLSDTERKYGAIRFCVEHLSEYPDHDQDFIKSLASQFSHDLSLSPRQWEWIYTFKARIKGAELLYGDMDRILVMFRLAGEKMQSARDRTDRFYDKPPQPKVRLMTSDDIFVQLTFNMDKPRQVDIYRDGWQGHGKRKFVGWIRDGKMIPYQQERMTETIKTVIQDFSLDPEQIAKAMAQRLGVCTFCGQRLTDPESKSRGYGSTCADNYQLPWGTGDLPDDLSTLFK